MQNLCVQQVTGMAFRVPVTNVSVRVKKEQGMTTLCVGGERRLHGVVVVK